MKRLQHLLELRGGAELEGSQTKETEERAAADRNGGVTNDGRMAQLRGARDHGEGETLYIRSIYEKAQRAAEKRQGAAGEGAAGGGAGARGGAAPVSPCGQYHKICAPEGAKGPIRRAF
jgi:hypothetical protein